MKLSRYRMKTHEKLDFGRSVNACLSEDVADLESRHKSVKRALEGVNTWVGELLDAYDNLSNDLKGLLSDSEIGKLIEKKLQESDLIYNKKANNICGYCGHPINSYQRKV